MTAIRIFALLALLPAALGSAATASGRSLVVPICGGDGVVRSVSVPLEDPKLPGSDPAGCCAKGCHGGSSRKKASGVPDPSA